LPQFRSTGLLLGLLSQTYAYAQKAGFLRGETNFIWDTNQDSRLLSLHNMKPHNTYHAYEFAA
jgi:P pilus assembly chaperone PapD